jgi:hypothetical protein
MLKTCLKNHKYFFYDSVADYVRLRSELPLEEKVFIHAELTPMAKPEEPIVIPRKSGWLRLKSKPPLTVTPERRGQDTELNALKQSCPKISSGGNGRAWMEASRGFPPIIGKPAGRTYCLSV